jgi:hypothetical protein
MTLETTCWFRILPSAPDSSSRSRATETSAGSRGGICHLDTGTERSQIMWLSANSIGVIARKGKRRLTGHGSQGSRWLVPDRAMGEPDAPGGRALEDELAGSWTWGKRLVGPGAGPYLFLP